MLSKSTIYTSFFLLFAAFNLNAKENYNVVTLTEGLNYPWGLAFLANGDFLITERSGSLKLLSQASGEIVNITGLPPIEESGQGGLLDIALHPNFEENHWLYFSYAALNQYKVKNTHVARAKWKSGDQSITDWQIIFQSNGRHDGGRHFGSRMVFDQQGYLYISTGDRGHRPSAQDLLDHSGSIIRLHDDGRIPDDNPFINNKNAKAEIYSYGHRNPQGMILDNDSGELWTHEHGPQGGDELNLVKAGNNYGWPVITYGKNYVIGTSIGEGTNKAGMQQPFYYWTPSIAPSGLTIYKGNKFPEWQNNFFVGSLKFSTLVRLQRNGNAFIERERMLSELKQRIRDVRLGPDELLYILTDSHNGKLLRLEPNKNDNNATSATSKRLY